MPNITFWLSFIQKLTSNTSAKTLKQWSNKLSFSFGAIITGISHKLVGRFRQIANRELTLR